MSYLCNEELFGLWVMKYEIALSNGPRGKIEPPVPPHVTLYPWFDLDPYIVNHDPLAQGEQYDIYTLYMVMDSIQGLQGLEV